MTGDPTSDHFASGQCRGMILIRSLMDEVTFNKAGNELVMRKRSEHSDRSESDELETLPTD